MNDKSLELQVITDDLTGLFNRRYLKSKLREETERSLKEKSSFGLIMLDLDHFKEVNDNYGHFEGDQALLWITKILRSSVREGDFVVRFAGDEFFLILPGANIEEAQKIATRIYSNISKLPFRGSKLQVNVPVGISGGIAIFPEDARSVDKLMESADTGLYMAKEQGRGKICLASEAKKIKEKRLDKNKLMTPPFMGRDKEFALIHSLWKDVQTNKQGAVVLIQGDSGMGKTRFIQEFSKSLNHQEKSFFSSTCYPREYVVPYQSIIDLLNHWIKKDRYSVYSQYCSLDVSEQRELLKLIPEFELSVKKIIYDVYDLDESGNNNSRLYYGVSNLFLNASQQKPLIFIIEDVQWIDTAAFNLLSHIFTQIAKSPVLFILTTQPVTDENSQQIKLKKFFRTLGKEIKFEEIVFEPFINDIQKQIVNKIFNLTDDDDLSYIEQILINESEGNPLFIKELLLKAIEEKIIILSENGWQVDESKQLTTPEKIRDITTEKIETLDTELKTILQQASVIGKEFIFDILKFVCNENEGYLLDIIDAALSQALLEEKINTNEEIFSFSSLQIQKRLYDELSSLRKKRLHLKVMEILEKDFHTKRGDYIEAMFFHASKAKDYAKSFLYGLKSAQKAYQNHGLKESKLYFEKIIVAYSKLDENQKKIYQKDFQSSMFTYVENLILLGQYEQANHILKTLPDNALKNKKEAVILFNQGNYTHALFLYEKAMAMTTDNKLKSQIRAGMTQVLLNEGKYDMAAVQAQESLKIATQIESPITEAVALNTLGNVYFNTDDLSRSLKYYTDSLRIYHRLKERPGKARCLNNIALIHYKKKKYSAALHCFMQAEYICKEISLRSLELFIFNNIGNIYLDMNMPDDAEQNLKKSLYIAEDMGNISAQIASYINLAHIYENTAIDKSKKYILKALDLCVSIGELSKESFIYTLLADLADKQNDTAQSESWYLKAILLRKKLKAKDDEIYSSIKLLELYKKTDQTKKFNDLYENVNKILSDKNLELNERRIHLKKELNNIISS